eukprot:TRINITY_DN2661_c0_g1_i1.p1 TRINITY_DN2661_c0_g1~~TRINITY_DN2661_c0_g1_i1.p1  ORF type:complete len:633 (-),score=251.94 TRINITY_DN2661_c0_g1_i1:996-2894(-)
MSKVYERPPKVPRGLGVAAPVATHGSLIKGFLKKKSPKGPWQKRYNILKEGIVYYFKTPRSALPQGTIDITTASVEILEYSKEFVLVIEHPWRRFEMKQASQDDHSVKIWYDAIMKYREKVERERKIIEEEKDAAKRAKEEEERKILEDAEKHAEEDLEDERKYEMKIERETNGDESGDWIVDEYDHEENDSLDHPRQDTGEKETRSGDGASGAVVATAAVVGGAVLVGGAIAAKGSSTHGNDVDDEKEEEEEEEEVKSEKESLEKPESVREEDISAEPSHSEPEVEQEEVESAEDDSWPDDEEPQEEEEDSDWGEDLGDVQEPQEASEPVEEEKEVANEEVEPDYPPAQPGPYVDIPDIPTNTSLGNPPSTPAQKEDFEDSQSPSNDGCVEEGPSVSEEDEGPGVEDDIPTLIHDEEEPLADVDLEKEEEAEEADDDDDSVDEEYIIAERKRQQAEKLEEIKKVGRSSVREIIGKPYQVVKFNFHGKKNSKRWLKLSETQTDFQWGTKPTKFDTKRTVLVSDIRWICSGAKSKSFKRRPIPSKEQGMCMSVVLKDRTIDVKFESVKDRDVWFLGLQHLIEKSLVENGFSMITKGRLVMQRVMDRVRARAEEEKISLGSIVAKAINATAEEE